MTGPEKGGRSSPGWLSVYPYGAPFPGTSTVNFSTGATAIANGAIVALPPDPTGTLPVQLSVTTGMYYPSDTVGLILDIT
ncbi:MAG TPA: hypothetical protein VFW15_13175, partial [Thermoanaerobaculia bacterium]|nr:hypothetical protein [Thermoanaerobaculia bacterium]